MLAILFPLGLSVCEAVMVIPFICASHLSVNSGIRNLKVVDLLVNRVLFDSMTLMGVFLNLALCLQAEKNALMLSFLVLTLESWVTPAYIEMPVAQRIPTTNTTNKVSMMVKPL